MQARTAAIACFIIVSLFSPRLTPSDSLNVLLVAHTFAYQYRLIIDIHCLMTLPPITLFMSNQFTHLSNREANIRNARLLEHFKSYTAIRVFISFICLESVCPQQ